MVRESNKVLLYGVREGEDDITEMENVTASAIYIFCVSESCLSDEFIASPKDVSSHPTFGNHIIKSCWKIARILGILE